MKQLTLFRILSFVLLPFAAIFGLMDLIMLLGALANPAVLLPVFLIAAFCIYVFASLVFLIRHISTGQAAKPSFKDWIKVNAYASLFLGFLFLFNSLSIFYMKDSEMRELIQKFLDMQTNLPANINAEMFIKMMRGAAYFLFFFSIGILLHIRICLGLVKQYQYLFSEDNPHS